MSKDNVVLVGFMLVILVPLAWVLLLSIKSIPDAYRPGFWPENFDFTHYEYVVEKIREQGIECSTGEFQAMMDVSLVNDGPVTILIDSEKVF